MVYQFWALQEKSGFSEACQFFTGEHDASAKPSGERLTERQIWKFKGQIDREQGLLFVFVEDALCRGSIAKIRKTAPPKRLAVNAVVPKDRPEHHNSSARPYPAKIPDIKPPNMANLHKIHRKGVKQSPLDRPSVSAGSGRKCGKI